MAPAVTPAPDAQVVEEQNSLDTAAQGSPVADSEESTPAGADVQTEEPQQTSETVQEESAVSEVPESAQDTNTPADTTAAAGGPASPNIVIIPETARQAPSSKIKVLQVIAKGQCWIEAKVDAELTTDFYVRKGERVDIKFQENLAVKFGNIGEITLRYNGKPYPFSVPANGVKTLVFPPASS